MMVDATEMEALMMDAKNFMGPTPRDYAAMGTKRKKKVLPTEEKEKNMKKGRSKVPDIPEVAFEVNDVVKKYMTLKGTVDFETLKKRVHSKAWHDERNRCRAAGMSAEEFSDKAGIAASAAVTRFRAAYGA